MSLEVGIVGLANAGKTTIFNALTRAHAETHAADRPNVGMASIVDDRLERVAKQAKSGDAALRSEVAELEALLAHLDAGNTLRDYPRPLPTELEPLTTKPIVPIVNGPTGIDGKLEAELAELPSDEAAAFREGPSALDEVVLRLEEALGLISFFTANDAEARAWTLRRGQTAFDAAATVHTDMARGFIRCEVIHWRDLDSCGS